MTSGSNTIAYKYNQDGVRIEKTVGTLRYEYTVSGTRIEREKIFDGSTLKKDSYFYYDASGIPCSAKIYVYNGTSRSEYNLILESNIQGDITEIYTSDGTLLVSYTYGAWGQIHVKYAISDSTLSNLAIDVPFKYRGYYHDQETGFYYLNSRYYDPYMMRFINADGYVSTGQGLNGNNMYAYCNNNPVMYVDPNGEFVWLIASFVAGCAVGTTMATVILMDEETNETPQTDITEQINLYDDNVGKRIDGKINVKFSPNNKDENGNLNPSFQIENSYEIKSKEDQRVILQYIMASDFYSQDVYCRTLDSMLIEWDAHNDLKWIKPNESRLASVDFDKNSETLGYWDYYKLAVEEQLKIWLN